MPDPVTAARYRPRDGTEHQVLVERDPERGWRVVDAIGDDAIVVDTLAGEEDRRRDAPPAGRGHP